MKKGFNSNKNLILFFVFTLAWTWICGLVPTLLGIMDTTVGRIIFYFGGGAPSVVGLFFVIKTYPKALRKDYFKRYFNVAGLKERWLFFIIAYFVIITTVGLLISVKFFGYNMPGMRWSKTLIQKPYMIFIFLFLSYLSGPLNEEFGWRGYSLDRLFIRFGYFKSSLLLGFTWAIWHFFWSFSPDQVQFLRLQHSFGAALLYIPSVICLNFVVSFIYVKNKRSIFAGLMVHLLSNFITSQLLMPSSVNVSIVIGNVSIVVGIIFIIYSSFSKKFKAEFQLCVDDFKNDVALAETSE